VHEVVELVDENEYVHESSESTEEALFVTLAEKSAEEAPLLLRFWWRFWLGFSWRFWLGLWFWLGVWLWLEFGLWFRLWLWLRLRFGVRSLEGKFPCLVASEDPAATARAQLLEQGPRFVRVELDVARRVEPFVEHCSRGWVASNLQFLSELLRIPSRQLHTAAVASCEEALESLGLVHSPGFSGVPGRPSGNISTNLLATAAGTRPSTFPPNDAISFTPLEETKLTSGLAIT